MNKYDDDWYDDDEDDYSLLMVGRYPLDVYYLPSQFVCGPAKICRNFPFNYPGESSIKFNVIHSLLWSSTPPARNLTMKWMDMGRWRDGKWETN